MSIQVVADPHSSCTETQKGNFARAPNSEPEATSHGEQGEEATSSHSTQAEHMQYDATENNTCEDACSDNEYCLRCMDKTIDAELARRQFWINLDPSIHHFNYDGQGVYDPTDTSPGECFAIIMAQKRHQESRSPGAYRIRSIINRARLFLDPIAGIVDADMLHLRGSELAQAVEGKVKKSYSTHGRWQFIEREAEEIYVSPAIPQCYLEANIIFDSGFMCSPEINMAKEYVAKRPSPYIPSPKGHRRKWDWKPLPSPLGLHQMRAATDDTDTQQYPSRRSFSAASCSPPSSSTVLTPFSETDSSDMASIRLIKQVLSLSHPDTIPQYPSPPYILTQAPHAFRLLPALYKPKLPYRASGILNRSIDSLTSKREPIPIKTVRPFALRLKRNSKTYISTASITSNRIQDIFSAHIFEVNLSSSVKTPLMALPNYHHAFCQFEK
ncbi:hypothetical protein N7456_001021 [Penicillium angulare]|uniref:Uncharacterized protein n=1 Tax=Penicillium angulare TaxID=116970 RepID=A0A9W9KSF4_9EURO|nr:hypothetical protein N7456_001021 [Penicillium angulare]